MTLSISPFKTCKSKYGVAHQYEWPKYKRCPECPKARQLARLYDLTPEKWEQMFESQGRCCAICKRTDPKWKKGWSVEHCHGSDRVRGITCQPCNMMIANSKDRPEVLRAGALYVEAHAALARFLNQKQGESQ